MEMNFRINLATDVPELIFWILVQVANHVQDELLFKSDKLEQ